jgi:hypothetical protein
MILLLLSLSLSLLRSFEINYPMIPLLLSLSLSLSLSRCVSPLLSEKKQLKTNNLEEFPSNEKLKKTVQIFATSRDEL